MSVHSPVRVEHRGGKRRLIIDFPFRDSDGRRKRCRRDATDQTMAGARAEAKRLIELAARTGSPFGLPPVPTLSSFVHDIYRPVFMPQLRPGTRERYEGILRQELLAGFGNECLDSIDYARVLAYAAKLKTRPRRRSLRGRSQGVDPRGPVNLLRSILRAAVQAKVLRQMPDLPGFPEGKKLPGAPGPDHVTSLLGGTAGWLRTAVALQALAGLRQGEVRALEVGDVDLARALLRVRRALSETTVVAPKGNRDRVVPIHRDLAQILATATKDKLAKALVVTDEDGRPVPRQRYLARLKRAQRLLGLEEWSSHSLRHFFCSELARSGVNIEVLRTLAGHGAGARVTLRYLHAHDGDLVHAISKLGNGVETT